MPEFRLIQISDTHLARRLPTLTQNFHRVSEYIDARRPDLVINSGDLAFDAPTSRDDLEFARELHAALPVACRYLPGNHDIGDNPTELGPAPPQLATEQERQNFLSVFGEDRWRFDAAGWRFIGLNSLVMNTGLASEAEQYDWLASQLSSADGKPVALFGFVISDARQEVIGIKEVGLVEYRFQPDSFEVRHVKAPGQIDVDLDSLIGS